MIIRRKDTGQTLVIDDPEEAKRLGIQLPVEAVPEKSTIQKVAETGASLGKSLFVDPYIQYAQIGINKKPLLGVKTPAGPIGVANPIPEDLGEVGNQLDVALTTLGITNPLKLLKAPLYSSKKGLAHVLDKAYTDATKQGVTLSRDEILKRAKGGTNLRGLQKNIEQFIVRNFPDQTVMGKSGINFKPMSPSQAWDINKDIGRNFGPKIFERFVGPSPEAQAAREVRNAVSTLLKEKVPASKVPNTLYSKYAGPLGSPANVVAKGGLGLLANTILGNPVGNLVGRLTGSPVPNSVFNINEGVQ